MRLFSTGELPKPMKPKVSRAGSLTEVKGYDGCQTPPYALEPLLPYLKAEWHIWESASGEGMLVNEMNRRGLFAFGTDLLYGYNYFDFQPMRWDISITNPPYSIKYAWLKRSYELGKPFALLLPVETLGASTAQKLFDEHGAEFIFMDQRVDFKMPFKGWHESKAQFPVCWVCWKLTGQPIVYASIKEAKRRWNDGLKSQAALAKNSG